MPTPIGEPKPPMIPDLPDPRDLRKPYIIDDLPQEVVKRLLCISGVIKNHDPVAKITLKVTAYHGLKDLSDPARGFCAIEDPIITDDAGGRVYIMSGDARTFRIKKLAPPHPAHPHKPLVLEFTILPTDAAIAAGMARDRYCPVGIFIDSTGMEQNFSLTSISGNVLRVLNHYVEGEKYWELLIGIRDAVSNQLGIIDPGVEDEDPA